MRSGATSWAAESWTPEATVEIPLLGVVAAGQPYRAFEIDETLSVPEGLWDTNGVFALRVKGNSMIDEGIHDGDYLIVEPRETAANGQTVVAEVDGCVTVKKFYIGPDGEVRLQPANPEMLPLVIRGEHVRVRGIVAGVLRKYGFARQPPRAKGAAPAMQPGAPPDQEKIEVAVNALDAQLSRWNQRLEAARRDPRRRARLAVMESLGRDLQSLRDWCARTTKPTLRRALVAEANRIMRKMQRFAG